MNTNLITSEFLEGMGFVENEGMYLYTSKDLIINYDIDYRILNINNNEISVVIRNFYDRDKLKELLEILSISLVKH